VTAAVPTSTGCDNSCSDAPEPRKGIPKTSNPPQLSSSSLPQAAESKEDDHKNLIPYPLGALLLSPKQQWQQCSPNYKHNVPVRGTDMHDFFLSLVIGSDVFVLHVLMFGSSFGGYVGKNPGHKGKGSVFLCVI
jgi:hypothetical protein